MKNYRCMIRIAAVSWCIGLFMFPRFCGAQSPNTIDLEKNIAEALAGRNAYLDRQPLFKKALLGDLSMTERLSIKKILEESPEPNDPWYNYFYGIIQPAAGGVPYCQKALALAVNDAGLTWALAFEFSRKGFTGLLDTALCQLQRQLLVSGVESAPLLSRQLLHLAVLSEKTSAVDKTNLLNRWAQVFDPISLWPSVRSVYRTFKQHSDFLQNIRESVWLATNSWTVQIKIIECTVRCLFMFFLVFSTSIMVILGLRYLPRVAHPIAETYPQTISIKVRSALAVLIVLATAVLGLVPFLWVLAFILWSRMDQRDRVAAGIGLVFLALTPMLTITLDTSERFLSPTSSPALFVRATKEGLDQRLDSALSVRSRAAPADYLAHLGFSMAAIRNNDLRAAQSAVKKALIARPGDQVAPVMAALVNLYGGNGEQARDQLKKCIQAFPKNAFALYNLGQSSIENMETLEGMDFIARATKLDPARINAFIEQNDRYFPKDRPTLRKYLFPEYLPSQFWESIFQDYSGDFFQQSGLWTGMFFGVPPFYSFLLFVVLLAILLYMALRSDPSLARFKRLLTCEVCGATMCRKCNKGLYCKNCFEQLRTVHDDHQRDEIKNRIVLRKRLTRITVSRLIDMAFPGLGILYGDLHGRTLAVVLVLAGALLYGGIITLALSTFAYPHWVTTGLFVPLVALCVLFNGVFVIRGIAAIYRAAKPQEK